MMMMVSQLSRPLSTISFLKNVSNKNFHVLSYIWHEKHNAADTRRVFLPYIEKDARSRNYSRDVPENSKIKSKIQFQKLLAEYKEMLLKKKRTCLIVGGTFFLYMISAFWKECPCDLEKKCANKLLEVNEELAEIKKMLEELKIHKN